MIFMPLVTNESFILLNVSLAKTIIGNARTPFKTRIHTFGKVGSHMVISFSSIVGLGPFTFEILFIIVVFVNNLYKLVVET